MKATVKLKQAVGKEINIKLIGDGFISNGHWAAAAGWFKETIDKATVRALVPGCDVQPMEQKILDKLVPSGKRAKFERSPLMWDAYGFDAVCFVAEDARRVWFNRKYIEAFDVVELWGTGIDKPFLDTNNAHEFALMLMPFRPPDDDKFAPRILCDGPNRQTSKEAVAVSVPAPCAARGCSNPTKEGKHCPKHTAGSANEPYESESVGKPEPIEAEVDEDVENNFI